MKMLTPSILFLAGGKVFPVHIWSVHTSILAFHHRPPLRGSPGAFRQAGEAEKKTRRLVWAISERKYGERFIAYNNGTVLDTHTNLMWASKDNGSDINWDEAKSYCENYRGGGYADWRMPTQYELSVLYDLSIEGNNRYHLTNLITLTSCCPWTSETRAYDRLMSTFSRIPVRTGVSMARFVDFSSGTGPILMDLQPTESALTSGRSRCVQAQRVFGHLRIYIIVRVKDGRWHKLK